jgi:hypothetical protein
MLPTAEAIARAGEVIAAVNGSRVGV